MSRAVALIALLCGLHAAAMPLPFAIQASAYVVQVDGQTRWDKAGDQALAPASLTKLMTALLVLENYQPQSVVSVGDLAARETGTRLGLKPRMQMRVGDLLAAMMLLSANDACHALADHVAGNESRFVQLMNQRAKAWGLSATHFSNACGHDDAQHRSSANDLAALGRRAMAQPVLSELAAQPSMRIASADGTRAFDLRNSNALIGRYEGAVGLKTGFTPKAGKCVVALARRGTTTVLLVMLQGANRWWDASDILDHAFAHAHDSH
jgi:D-alanyl-D-alanine carboxypeptidase (penicillin-binding protein 5/6)